MGTRKTEEGLRKNEGKRVRSTFSDGVMWTADIQSVDDEGFLHSGPDGADPGFYWTRFEDAAVVEPPYS
jgi:hypothetical protein